MMETSCWVVYPGVGEKKLAERVSAKEVVQFISMAKTWFYPGRMRQANLFSLDDVNVI
jgi:hypothetical protein